MGTERHDAALAILVIEDDPDIAEVVAEVLSDHGHQVTTVGDGERGLHRLAEECFDLLLCDVRLPGIDGMEVFARVKRAQPELPVILMSAYGSIAEAVDAVKRDAAHYLAKPFSIDDLLAAVEEVARDALRTQRLQAAGLHAGSGPHGAIVGQTPAMVALRQFVHTVADADGPVLITGETGTGKELVASTIHALGPRHGRPFVAVNCAAFPETLLEAELFGHERGAFTGAMQRREGRFRTADGGTLFLDEIGEMAGGAQAKLLRVLEDGSFQPLGSDATLRVDVRLISATNADLRGAGAERFRSDLFYRLKMFHVHIPPLRERLPDLPLLVGHLLAGMTDEPPPISPRAWAALSHHDYPGNVRELRNALGHALAVSRGQEIDLKHLPADLRGGRDGDNGTRFGGVRDLQAAEREFERDYLLRTLDAAGWNRTRAAEMLGISRKTLWKKLRDLGIRRPASSS